MKRFLQLFRALVPSWRFFETLGAQPVLYYRWAAPGLDFGEWQLGLRRPARGVVSPLVNGEGNLHLACYTLLDQLEEDIGDLDAANADAFARTTSYQLTQNLVWFLMRERREIPTVGGRYQFKIVRVSPESGVAEEFLVSTVYAVEAV